MRTKDIYSGIAILTLLILLGLSHCNRKTIVVPDPYDYVTDTIRIDKEYEEQLYKQIAELKEENQVLREAPPKIVREYITPDPEYIDVEKIPDSIILYMRHLETRIAISDKFLKNYPEASKLINFNLNRDELSLGLLTIEGNTFEKTYPLYLDTYDYAWFDNKLHYYETSVKKPFISGNKRVSDLIAYIDYRFLDKTPKLELEYSINLNRFKLRTSTNYIFRENDPFEIQAGVGYRLFNN